MARQGRLCPLTIRSDCHGIGRRWLCRLAVIASLVGSIGFAEVTPPSPNTNAGLSIRLDAKLPVYPAHDKTPIEVRVAGCSLTELAGQADQHLLATIHRVADDTVVDRQSWTMAVDAEGKIRDTLWPVKIPSQPGVYEIRCELRPAESGIWSRIRRQDVPVTRISQPFVVLPDALSTTPDVAMDWREIALIRPTDLDRSKLTQWIPGSNGRLYPLAATAVQNHIERGQHAGQTTSLLRAGERFETSLPTLVPGLPQQVTLRFPVGRQLRMRVEMLRASDGTAMTDFLLAEENLPEGDEVWREHSWIYYPVSVDARLRLTNLATNHPAAIESISVHAGPGRCYRNLDDTFSEPDSTPRLAVYTFANWRWVNQFSSDIPRERLSSQYDSRTLMMHRLFTATARLQDYLQSQGMNAVVLPAISRDQAWLESSSVCTTHVAASADSFKLPLVMKLLESSPLQVFAGIDAMMPLPAIEAWIADHPEQAAGVTQSADTNHLPLDDDNAAIRLYNPLHRKVQAAVVMLIQEVNEQLQSYPNYAGISLQDSESGSLWQMSSRLGLDVVSLRQFADSAMATQANAPSSLKQLEAWVAHEGEPSFTKWKADRMAEWLVSLSSKVDGRVLLPLEVTPQNQTLSEALVRTLVAKRVSHPDTTLSELAILARLSRNPVGTLPRQLRLRRFTLATNQTADNRQAAPAISTGAMLSDLHYQTGDGYDIAPQPMLRHRTLADVTRMIERFDPSILMFDGSDGTASVQHDLAAMLAEWTSLPTVGLVDVAAADPVAVTSRVRFGRGDQYYYLMISNLPPWASDITVQTSASLTWQLADNVTRESGRSGTNAQRLENNGLRTSLRIGPQQVVVLRAKADVENVSVVDWHVSVAGGTDQITRIAEQVTRIVDRLGGLADPATYPVLSNGGFEAGADVGLAGWLHTQHPPGAVRIDDKEAFEGRRSALLTTDQAMTDRTWMVSEMIPPPRSGRLGVSLACRADHIQAPTVHRLRISLEGTRAGEPIRRSAEIEIPHSGQWQTRQLVLEVDGVTPPEVDLLRLTIDSLSPGRVWIDNVRLHDRFPVSKERSELQGEAYVAVQGLQQGNLSPAARLLQNEWAQHLLTLEDPVIPAVLDLSVPPKPSAGVADRLRNWLPRPLRF